MTREPLKIEPVPAPPGVALFRLAGRLEAHGSVQLRELCSPPQCDATLVVLNLSGVTFLSSSGIGALLAICEMQQERGGTVHLACVRDGVRTTLELMNLDVHLVMCASEQEALRPAA